MLNLKNIASQFSKDFVPHRCWNSKNISTKCFPNLVPWMYSFFQGTCASLKIWWEPRDFLVVESFIAFWRVVAIKSSKKVMHIIWLATWGVWKMRTNNIFEEEMANVFKLVWSIFKLPWSIFYHHNFHIR